MAQLQNLPQTTSPTPPDLPFSDDYLRRRRRTLSLRAGLSELCRDGRVDAARLIFDSLPRPPPTVLCNALLIGYVSNSLPRHALALLSLFSTSIAADHYTYSSALTACADAVEPNLGRSIHAHILRRSAMWPKNTVLNNALLNMYASTSHSSVINVFDRMPRRNVVAWNILISWYTRFGKYTEAIRRFNRMLYSGIMPTAISFVSVLPAVILSENNRRLCVDVLYGSIVKIGAKYVDDMFVVSSVILAYSEISDVLSARKVFDRASEKNVEVWNTMIRGYVQNGEFSEGIKLFREILEFGDSLAAADTVTFLSTLIAVSHLQDFGLGRQIHGYLAKKNLRKTLPVILWNALLVMYSRCGSVESAFELFHQMPERDMVSWNTMISAFVQNGLDFEGILLACQMQKEGFVVDSVTILALLSAASNLSNLNIGKETHGYLIRHGIQCQGMTSYIIDMYSKSGSVDTAWKIFNYDQSEKRDLVTWNSMIAGFVKNQKNECAVSVFRKMLDKNNQLPNSVTLTTILPACGPYGGIKFGKGIHGFAIRIYLEDNVFVGTALADMYSKCGDILSAERVFHRITEKTTVAYTTMITGFGQHGLGERALFLFQTLKDSGMKIDAITFVAVISACSYSGLVEEGISVFRAMQEYGVVPTPEHYCCVVDMLGRAGRLLEAYEFIQSLGDSGNFVKIWGSLLAACKVHRDTEMGDLAAKRLFEITEEGNREAGYHVLLSNTYAAEGKWGIVDRVRREMRDKGLRKECGTSWIDDQDLSSPRTFMSTDQSQPENDQVYTMLEELAAEMKLSSSSKAVDICLEERDVELDK